MDYSITSGKCCDCNDNKPLDEMVRKEGKKGLYHCVDCETNTEWNMITKIIDTGSDKEMTTLNKVMAWCFG